MMREEKEGVGRSGKEVEKWEGEERRGRGRNGFKKRRKRRREQMER